MIRTRNLVLVFIVIGFVLIVISPAFGQTPADKTAAQVAKIEAKAAIEAAKLEATIKVAKTAVSSTPLATEPMAAPAPTPLGANRADMGISSPMYALAFAFCVQQTAPILGAKDAKKSCEMAVRQDRERAVDTTDRSRPNEYGYGGYYNYYPTAVPVYRGGGHWLAPRNQPTRRGGPDDFYR